MLISLIPGSYIVLLNTWTQSDNEVVGEQCVCLDAAAY